MTLFYHLVEFCKCLKYNRCYCITEDGFVALGTVFCPKTVPNVTSAFLAAIKCGELAADRRVLGTRLKDDRTTQA